MKQLLAWTGSADSTITSEAVMAMAEKFNSGQEVCLQIPSARGVMQVKEGTSGSDAALWLIFRTTELHCKADVRFADVGATSRGVRHVRVHERLLLSGRTAEKAELARLQCSV